MATSKQWTFMVYFAADNNLDRFARRNLRQLQSIGSSNAVNLIAQLDPKGTGRSARYFLRKSKQNGLSADRIAELPSKQDIGLPGTLSDFILWGAAEYPAQHYLVVVWGHGKGWDDDFACVTSAFRSYQTAASRPGVAASSPVVAARSFATPLNRPLLRGIGYEGTAQDFLSNPEFKAELMRVSRAIGRKIDILGLDACLMNMVEVGYEIRDSVSLLVASEETIPNESWPYDRIARLLVQSPGITPGELASAAVDEYVASYKNLKQKEKIVTLSACDLGSVEKLAGSVEHLGGALSRALPDPRNALALVMARTAARSYFVKDYVDLYDFCERLSRLASDDGIQAACRGVLGFLEEGRFVIRSGSNEDPQLHPTKYDARSHGVSIYFPAVPPCYSTDLDFAKTTRWPVFLSNYLTMLLESDWNRVIRNGATGSSEPDASGGDREDRPDGDVSEAIRFIVRFSRNRSNVPGTLSASLVDRSLSQEERYFMNKDTATDKFPVTREKTVGDQLVELLNQKFPVTREKSPAEQLIDLLGQKFPLTREKTPAEQLVELLTTALSDRPSASAADRELVFEVRIRQLGS